MKGDHGEYSDFVVEAIRFTGCHGGLALDIPSGDGRHSRLLTSYGFQVVSADLDMKALLRGASALSDQSNSPIGSVRLDATKSLPFRSATFDLALLVHFPTDSVLRHLEQVIKKDGFLILETFGGHGENWRALPLVAEVRNQLVGGFRVLQYVERPIKRQPNRVTVRAIGRKN